MIDPLICFSPLAGIRYVETSLVLGQSEARVRVSVPLRGLDMWKPSNKRVSDKNFNVSVPLRGLDMWKLALGDWDGSLEYAVSVPLRGLDMWKL